MEWQSAENRADNAVAIPGSWLLLHYYEALNILFRMENSLRVFVYVILKNEFKKSWVNTQLDVSEGENLTIANAASKRISQAKSFGYLGYEINSPLMFLNSGELIRLILSDSYWRLFKTYFKAKKEIIQNKFEEIGTVRNSLAHFRPLKNDDVDLIKQNIKHSFIGIEECLTEMTSTHNVVPTNSNENWYKALIVLGDDLCKVRLFQSKLQQWIRMEITYLCPIIRKNEGEDYAYYTLLKLIAPAILKNFSELASLSTYMTEHNPYASKKDGKDPSFTKVVSLVFTRAVLNSDYQKIVEQVKELFAQIKSESELVKKDNLASGKLVETARAYASLNEKTKRWVVNVNSLKGVLQQDDPTEYWGDLGLYGYDFIAKSNKYPWMPSEISKDDDEIPF